MERERLPFAPERSVDTAHLPVGPASPRWRRFDRLVIAVVLVGLCAPWALLLGGRRPKPIENRPLVAFPQLTLAGVLDGTSMRGIDAFLADNIAVRSYAVRVRGEVMLLSGGTGNPQVLRGRDGWLFSRVEFEPRCPYPAATTAGAIGDVAAAFAKEGRTFRYVIAPDKHAIYPEQVAPDSPFPPPCTELERPAFRAAAAGFGPVVIDGWSALEAARTATPDQLLYYRGDTHWTPLGALVVVRSLVQSIDPALWNEADITTDTNVSRSVDLDVQVGVRRIEKVPGVTVRPGSVTQTDVAVPVQIHNARAVFRTVAEGRPTVPGRTLIIYDSFFGIDVRVVAPYFANATWVHDGDFVSQPELASLLGPFDTVIVEQVERGLYALNLASLLGPIAQ